MSWVYYYFLEHSVYTVKRLFSPAS